MATDPSPQDALAAPPPDRDRRGRTPWLVVKGACVAVALVHPIATALGRQFWIADLISHFQAPALVATVLACAVMIGARHRRLALVLAAIALFQVVPLLQYSGSNPVLPDPGSHERLRILMANVLYENESYDGLARLIEREKPDIVALVEYTPLWQQGLALVRLKYPYRREYPAGADGLALWFRKRPIEINTAEVLLQDRHPVMSARFEFAGRERRLWLVHPTSPFKIRFLEGGHAEIDAIADRIGEEPGSRIVVGDMNSTEGSAHFRHFLQVTGLRDSRLGFGRQGSWPTDRPYRIAIDHAFLSDDLAVVDRRLGPDVGSDHFPLILDVAPAVATKASTQSAHASTSSP